MVNSPIRVLPVFPPVWAGAWGDDVYGLWAELALPGTNITQRFRWIEPGAFWMGSPEDEPGRDENEGPRHLVRLSCGYWLADTACSQEFWMEVMGDNPSAFKNDPQNPVEQVSCVNVNGFLERVKTLFSGVSVSLPTEAEWEYACRAGTDTAFSWGGGITPDLANYRGNLSYADGPKGMYRKRTTPVKSFRPNPWGLYQMHGNVWEWCSDGLRVYGREEQVDPCGFVAPDADSSVVRGGSWNGEPRGLRAAARAQGLGDSRIGFQGFRFSLKSISPEK